MRLNGGVAGILVGGTATNLQPSVLVYAFHACPGEWSATGLGLGDSLQTVEWADSGWRPQNKDGGGGAATAPRSLVILHL